MLNTETSDCLNKIILASNLEKTGEIEQAIALYREVIEKDQEGTYRAIAQEAIAAIEKSNQANLKPETQQQKVTPVTEAMPIDKPWLKKFYDLPIAKKQGAALLSAELLSVLAVVGVGAFLIINAGKSQLVNQASSELEVLEINYKIKPKQLSLSHEAIKDNPAIIAAAEKKQSNDIAEKVLLNQIDKAELEIATIVDTDKKIIGSQEKFDPNGLVNQAIKTKETVTATEIISPDELALINPQQAQIRAKEIGESGDSKPKFLIRYVISPLESDSKVVGAIVTGDIVKPTIVKAFDNSYSGVYLRASDGKFILATSKLAASEDTIKTNVGLDDSDILSKAVEAKGDTVTEIENIEGKTYTLAAKAISNSMGEPVAILVNGTSHEGLNALIAKSLSLQGLVLILALLGGGAIAWLMGQAIVKPLQELQKMTEEFRKGDRTQRGQIRGNDEIGKLTDTFNQMADTIVLSSAQLEEQFQNLEAEATKQKQEKEKIQQEVIKLLVEIEGAQKGDLTVKARVTDGVVGSIADAFNVTLNSLRQLVLQVQSVSTQVNLLAEKGEKSVSHLSCAALNQAKEVKQARLSVAEIDDSIQSVASSAAEAARIARDALNQAQAGDESMDCAVDSIEKIRGTVATTSKQIKKLAESTQEISQIVGIISAISEKTNLLAFNASIEAARAGEHGLGFRVVADEVRRLADRVTEATKEIQLLVNTIQQETGAVLQSMENSNSEVVEGAALVSHTKEILQSLATTSQKIDEYLQTISASTLAQTDASISVNNKIKGVATVASNTSSNAQDVLKSLQVLVKQSKSLQDSILKFRV